MTDHLSTDELLAALDGPLGEDRLAHARACDACGTELARVEQTIAELRQRETCRTVAAVLDPPESTDPGSNR